MLRPVRQRVAQEASSSAGAGTRDRIRPVSERENPLLGNVNRNSGSNANVGIDGMLDAGAYGGQNAHVRARGLYSVHEDGRLRGVSARVLDVTQWPRRTEQSRCVYVYVYVYVYGVGFVCVFLIWKKAFQSVKKLREFVYVPACALK